MSDVLGVLLNYRRPANVLRILQAMREQSVRFAKICLVECSPHSEFSASPQACDLADSVISINTNIGPISRLLAPLAFPQHKYTYFGVDDHVPGSRHLEWMLATAASLNDNFATIGQDGRRVVGDTILRKRIGMDDLKPTPVDFVCSSELMLTGNATTAMQWRSSFLTLCGRDCSLFEDDLFLSFGIQNPMDGYGSGPPSYLTPEPPTAAESWRASRLHAPHALCGRENHHELRDHFVRRAVEFGWRSRVPTMA